MLASVCPPGLVEQVPADTGRASQRERQLPAPAVVYYVVALALWREAPLEEVLRVVCEGPQWLGGGEAGAVPASKSAISQARTRLGPEVMRQLADRVLKPVAAPNAPGAWYRGMRVTALDGSCMDVADGTAHAPYNQGEQTMAARLLPSKLAPDMRVVADRNFYGFKLWGMACATGAKLVWRIKSAQKLSVDETLPDGSYLSAVFDHDNRRRSKGVVVRVIDYTLNASATPVEDNYRLVTNILDPDAAPALELAALYQERWETEGVFDEFKTHLRANSTYCAAKRPNAFNKNFGGCC